MLFTSFEFAVFFATVFGFYWFLPRRSQNLLLLVASYLFYGFWEPWVLILLFGSTAVDFFVAHRLTAARAADPLSPFAGRNWLILSIAVQLGVLGVFKYFNFFAESLEALFPGLGSLGGRIHFSFFLPVGISFYTFKTMTYTIDVYRGQMRATTSFIDYATYVAFFPTLIAGPIARARDLVPQLANCRTFCERRAVDGAHLVFRGLFKKAFVADSLATFVAPVFDLPNPSGFQALAASYLFALQIYCDFGGYSDMARGLAKLLGIELVDNFRHPYFALNPSDFWNRWHISFSTWIRDYIFLPLGGAWRGSTRAYANLAITMVLAGLWHGASWLFVIWGAYQGLLLIGHRVAQPWMKSIARPFRRFAGQRVRKFSRAIVTFHMIAIGWILFRAEDLGQAWRMISSLFSAFGPFEPTLLMPIAQFGAPLLLMELLEVTSRRDDLFRVPSVPAWLRASGYAVFTYLIVFRGATTQGFIYTQF